MTVRTPVGEQGWIVILFENHFLEKNTINVFFGTNRLEIVKSGANLSSKLNFEEKVFHWKLP